jgi:hypothetical protein
MKAEGIDYDQRMELLEHVTWPKPLEELLGQAFETFAASQPWVRDFEPSPKSVVRDMYERAMTFGEYVAHYQLSRSEGLVLRYLSDAYRAARQTIPDDAKTDELQDLIEWLGELVRQVDSSLVDEWEQLAGRVGDDVDVSRPDGFDTRPPGATQPPVTQNRRAFTILVRNELFRRVQFAALENYDALGDLDRASGFDAEAWADAMDGYFADHDDLLAGANARGAGLLILDEGAEVWTARQIFDDPAGDHDWGIRAEVDLAASADEGLAVVHVLALDRL